MTEYRFDGPDDAHVLLLLSHGAGAGMDSEFLTEVAAAVGAGGVRVVRFEFPYMVKRRDDGKRRPPDRAPKLEDAFRAVVAAFPHDGPVILAGKSMGSRIGSRIADEVGAAGWAAFGFPFHAPGKPEKLERVELLREVQTPGLILQGERDPFGTKLEVPGYGLPDSIEVRWFADGDHSLKPRKKSGFSEAQHRADAAAALLEFIARR